MKVNKFRIWDNDSNRFIKGDFSLGMESGEIRGIYGEKFSGLEVNQYIGVNDKFDKEIFEGDIVKGKTFDDIDIFGVVVFDGGSYKIKGDVISFYRWYDYDIEIVGNIYENEKLLNS